MANNKLIVSRTINAPIKKVWQAWTDPNHIKHWFTAEDGSETEIIQFDVKASGKVRLKFRGAAGEYTWTYVKIAEPTELVFDILDFSLPQFGNEGAGGICSVRFKDMDGKTEVTISGDLAGKSEKMRRMAERGWGGTLDRLNKFISKPAENFREI